LFGDADYIYDFNTQLIYSLAVIMAEVLHDFTQLSMPDTNISLDQGDKTKGHGNDGTQNKYRYITE